MVINGPSPSGRRIAGRGVELAHLAVLGTERRLAAKAHAKSQREAMSGLPLVLQVKAIDGGAGQPACQLFRELRLAHLSDQETGEVVSRTRHDDTIRLQTGGHSSEREGSARVRALRGVHPESHPLVAHLENMGPSNLRQ